MTEYAKAGGAPADPGMFNLPMPEAVMPYLGHDRSPRAIALEQHNPPFTVWVDVKGQWHRKCHTQDPNPDCDGCRETATPPGEFPTDDRLIAHYNPHHYLKGDAWPPKGTPST